jgi:RNA polymerase sigma-70 factor, ECF subfamily
MKQPEKHSSTNAPLHRVVVNDRSLKSFNQPQAILPRVYEELRTLAAAYLRQERPNHTLQPTALVHETYVRLSGSRNWPWKSEAEFVAIAASVMRKVLVDHARRHVAEKRGGNRAAAHITIDQIPDAAHPSELNNPIDLLDLEQVLTRLEQLNPRQARLVEMRYFGGLSIEAAAQFMDISPRTAAYDWRMARAWLLNELAG